MLLIILLYYILIQKCGTFDGDTPEKKRKEIMKEYNMILSNPDILHYTVY